MQYAILKAADGSDDNIKRLTRVTVDEADALLQGVRQGRVTK